MDEQPIERPPTRRYYRDEDVRGILEKALAHQGREFTRTDLEAMAEELGISPDQLIAAEQAWFAEAGPDRSREAEFIAARRRQVQREVIGFVVAIIVVAILSQINFMFLPGLAALAGLLLFFKGIELAQEAYQAFVQVEGEQFDKAYDKWLDRQARRRLRRAERRGLPPTESS